MIKRVLNDKKDDKYGCNCRVKNECPLNGECKTPNIIYCAKVKIENDPNEKTYIGLCETAFKTRYSNHLKSFRHEKHKKETMLSQFIWNLKEKNINYDIKWNILKKSTSYNTITKACNLCLTEKLLICTFKHKNNLINKRTEFVSKCRHENKYLIKNIKT